MCYHSPAVAQHLDRVLPGWEGSVSVSVPSEDAGTEEASSDTENTWKSSGKKGGGGGGGCIPLHWILGVYGGSVPPEMSCFLMDWAVVNQLKYAGIYLTAALLELFSGALVTMTGGDIRVWLQSIASGQEDWYKSLPLCLPHPLSISEFSLTSAVTSWSEFTSGWVHAAAVLQQSTPLAYQQALKDTEQWANTLCAELPNLSGKSSRLRYYTF